MADRMLPARSFTTVALMMAAGVLLPNAPGQLVAEDQIVRSSPMVVTTDTPEYCLHLLDRVSEMVRLATIPVPREVTDLTTEGHRMCAHGQTRGGIMRLRSALMMMENGHAPAAYQ
ncbi:hypothetical protein [Rhodopila sp.]|uniref:hypothetical protein n=1 Tax=Rhodopila sp. TaxID=2480087 RepID=UPI003D095CDB